MRNLGIIFACSLLVGVLVLTGTHVAELRLASQLYARAPEVVVPVNGLLPGWRVSHVRTMTGPVNALLVGPGTAPTELRGLLFVGLSGEGLVCRFNPESHGTPVVVSESMGDTGNLGLCCVNQVGLHDLDGDGQLELLGSTSQVTPRGIPRLYVWSSQLAVTAPRAVARPDIRSSWSHSLAFLARPGQGPDSAFITFCGYGEIVEYRMKGHDASNEGFVYDELGWKVVGQLPASGEWIQVADADNDGEDDVCVAAGFSLGKSAIHFYSSPSPGAPLRLRRQIDEGGRFGNVRFQVADLGTGERDVVAWWCTDLAGGDAEVIAYRLGPEGVRTRSVLARGKAATYWPDDGQFTAADIDGDGRAEVWFATHEGDLWRYDPAGKASPTGLVRVARFLETLGPIAAGPAVTLTGRPRLYIGRGQSIVAIEPAPRASERSSIGGADGVIP